MTLLTAVNEACAAVGLPPFAAIAGTGDENADTMLQIAQEVGEEISRRSDWQRMLKSATVSSSPFPLPDGYQRLTPGGGIRTALGVFARKITNSSEWALLASAPPSKPFYFVRSGSLEFMPTTAATGAVIDYVSDRFVTSASGSEQADWRHDDDAPLFPERLLVRGIIWRWKREKGLVYDDDLAEFEADLASEIVADRGAS